MTAPILYEQVCYSLYSTSSDITKAYRQLLSELNITYPQFVVMMSLWQQDKITITEISQHTGITKSTLTPLIKLLVDKGYITIGHTESDERQKLVSLTQLGKDSAEKGGEVAEAAFCGSGLTPEEGQALIQLCQKIKHSLSEA